MDIEFCQMLSMHELIWSHGFFFRLLIWWITLIYFRMLNQSCFPEITSLWLWYFFVFIFYVACFYLLIFCWEYLWHDGIGFSFPLWVGFSWLFICRVILDCILHIQTLRYEYLVLFKSYWEWWYFCFSMQSTQLGSGRKFQIAFCG